MGGTEENYAGLRPGGVAFEDPSWPFGPKSFRFFKFTCLMPLRLTCFDGFISEIFELLKWELENECKHKLTFIPIQQAIGLCGQRYLQ